MKCIAGALLFAFGCHLTFAQAPTHDLSRDFSLAGNPNAAWSYGRQDTIGGAFTLLGTARTANADNGVPIQMWAINAFSQPVIMHNDTAQTALVNAGQGNFPPETTWFSPGVQGQPGNYAVARLTVPPGGAGTYRLVTTALPNYAATLQLDSDFHVARNNVEIFGVQLNVAETAGYTNTLTLAAGDTIDFAVGRGADNDYVWSGLKIEATLTRQTNASGLTLVVPKSAETNDTTYGGGTFSAADFRHQQVYGSNEFPSGAILIRELRFRPDRVHGSAFSTTVSNIQINLSTTQRNPSSLSSTYAQNVGSNDTVVFQGSLALSSQFQGPANGPKAFDMIVPLSQPFLYNPAGGHLVIDVRNSSGSMASPVSGQTGQDNAWRVLGALGSATGAVDSGVDAVQIVYSVVTNQAPPTITAHPTNQTVVEGGSATFSVSASGSAPLTYQWRVGATAIPDATNSTLVLTNVQLSQAGNYSVVVSNVFGVATSQMAILTVNPAPPEADHNLSLDFSLDGNPNGVWSYGRQDTIGGAFTLLGSATTANADNGVPVQLWVFSPSGQPAIFHNDTAQTAIVNGGQGNFPPETTWFAPGVSGQPGNYAVARFTVPPGGGGIYQVVTTARPTYAETLQLDSDFHVARNNVEIFGAQLNVSQTAGYTNNTLTLAAGDTIDFAVGRGADNSHIWSGLKIEATLTRQTGNALTLVVPSVSRTIDDGGGSGLLNTQLRHQIVYGASQFLSEIIRITELRLRPSSQFGSAFTSTIPNLQINLSTTSVQPNQLNGAFAQNVGMDDMVVFQGPLTVSSRFVGPVNGPKEFDIIIPLTTPFLYDSSRGNLLIDFRNASGSSASYVDIGQRSDDGSSRVFATSVGATSATGADPGAEVFQIVYTPQSGVAPFIFAQPQSQTAFLGQTVTLTVGASGSSPLNYQWRKGGAVITGATNSTLILTNVQLADAASYSVVVSNTFGVASSQSATLTVSESSVLVVPNVSRTIDDGGGSGLLNTQLRHQIVYGASQFPSEIIRITELRLRPSSQFGSAFTSTIPNLQINLSTTSVQPNQLNGVFAQNVGTNDTMVFQGPLSVSSRFVGPVNGPKEFDIIIPLTTPFLYDSSRGNLLIDLRNASGSSASYVDIGQRSDDGSSRVFATSVGATSATGADPGAEVFQIVYTLQGGSAPLITAHPTNQTVVEGSSATFGVSATGSGPLRHQWRRDASAITDATNSTLILTNVQLSQAGNYSVVVSNAFGTAASQTAILTVNPAGPDTNCLAVRQGLVSWWRAEGNAQDASGTNHGTLLGGGYVSGARGQAFSFDGDDRVAVPDSQSLQLTPSMSIEGWINIRDWPHNNSFGAGMVVYRGDDRPGLDPFYVDVLNTGVLQFAINSADNQFAGVTAPVVTNRFIHFAATLDDASGAMKLYVDGTLAAETTTTLRPAGDLGSPVGLGIGNAQEGSGFRFGFNGLVDELKLYSRALTPAEVRMLYTNAPCSVSGLTLVVPRSAETNDTTYGGGAFIEADFRHQQVYGSNEFPGGPMLIHELRFRPDRVHGNAFTTTVSNIRIKLSTTQRGPTALSPGYAENAGPDDTVVFQGSLPLSSQFQGPANGPKVFDMIVPLTQPFIYNPANGHLVVDMQNISGSSACRTSGQFEPDNAARVLGPIGSSTGNIDSGVDTIQFLYSPTTNTPPFITSHPAHQTVLEGNGITFSVTATGSAPLTYQWRVGVAAIPGATNSTLILTNVQLSHAGNYSVVVSNAFGTATSQTASLTVNPALPRADHDLSLDFSLAGNPNGVWSYGRQDKIGGAFTLLGTAKTNFANVPILVWAINSSSQPAILHNDTTETATIPQGDYPPETTWLAPGVQGQPGNYAVARLTVPAGGDGTYQLATTARPSFHAPFQLDTDFHVARNNLEIFGVQLNGAQTASYTNTLALAAGDTVDLAVGRGADNSYIGSQLKVAATLDRISSNGVPPIVLFNPTNLTVVEGGSVAFSVAATGSAPLRYQWRRDATAIADATNSTLILTNVHLSQAGSYSVVVSNAYGVATSQTATLTVLGAPPAIVTHPTNQTVVEGGSATFSVTASGSAPPGYQWRRGATAIPNATNSTLILTNVQLSHEGSYSVVVSNAFGGSTSQTAILTVSPPGPDTNCEPVRNGLVSWWRGEGNGQDASGTNHGTITAGGDFVWGARGQAFSFDGDDDRVVVRDSQSLQLTPSMSIEGWINIRAWPDNNAFGAAMVVFRGDDRSGLDAFYIAVLNTGILRFAITAADEEFMAIDAPVVTNRFIHFAATIDDASGDMKLYLDGALAAQTNTTARPIGDLGPFESGVGIGNAHQGSRFDFGFNGLVDELKLYSRALTLAEVRMLYTNAPCLEVPDFDVSRDFSLAGNPNGAWSYGRQETIGGAFTLLGTAKTNVANVPMLVWAINSSSQPAILHNDTTETVITDGGLGNYPPETTWFGPGVQGQPGNYAVARLTVPAGGDGTYQLVTRARPGHNASIQLDTDFHVARNNVEIFGAQLSGSQAAGYTNMIALVAGDTIDFAVGRGADNSYIWSQLKVEAALTKRFSKLQPSITNISGNRTLALTFNGLPGNYTIEASTNLIHWVTLTNIVGAAGQVHVSDPAINSLPQRFYRTRFSP